MNRTEFEKIINAFEVATDKEGRHLQMDSIIISDGEGNYFKHIFTVEDGLHPIRSICKIVVSMCYGILMGEGVQLANGSLLSFDTKIWPIIKHKVHVTNIDNIPKLEQITLFHLFTHSIGYQVKLLKTKDVVGIDPTTYLDLVCNTPIVYNPGEHFLYSNVAAFLLSVVFQELTNINLADFAKEKIFSRLGIEEFYWRKYDIYCAGATGLELKSEDLHKIARLIADNGVYKGEQIVPSEWVNNMHRPQVITPSMFDSSRVFPKYAYGLLMWICGAEENSNYFVDGSDGQYIIIIPQKNLVISTLAHQKDMKPITECLRGLID